MTEKERWPVVHLTHGETQGLVLSRMDITEEYVPRRQVLVAAELSEAGGDPELAYRRALRWRDRTSMEKMFRCLKRKGVVVLEGSCYRLTAFGELSLRNSTLRHQAALAATSKEGEQ